MDGLLQQAGERTILVSSHELGEIEGVATHVAFLDEGRLLFEDSMSDLNSRFREVRVTLEREPTPAGMPKDWLTPFSFYSNSSMTISGFEPRRRGGPQVPAPLEVKTCIFPIRLNP